MVNRLEHLNDEAITFLTQESHLGFLTTLRADGTPHVVAVGFTFDPQTGIARVITPQGSQKTLNIMRNPSAVLSQVDGRRWISLEGTAQVVTDPDRIHEAEDRFAQRYRPPRENIHRVAIEVQVQRVLASPVLLTNASGVPHETS